MEINKLFLTEAFDFVLFSMDSVSPNMPLQLCSKKVATKSLNDVMTTLDNGHT